MNVVHLLAEELSTAAQRQITVVQVNAAVGLLDEGATVPFIARYRKEVTQGLDDGDLRLLAERLTYLRELEARQKTILASIAEQQKLTPELQQRIEATTTKQALEDIYLPYKPKRRTRAQIAREAGLQPLADQLLVDASHDPLQLAPQFINAEAGFADTKAVMDGVRDILAEQFAEDADLLGWLRDRMWREGMLSSMVIEGKQTAGEKFQDYFAFEQTIAQIPSHRALALFRGRHEGILTVKLALSAELEAMQPHPCEAMIASHFAIARQGEATQPQPATKLLQESCRWAWRVKLQPMIETELLTRLRQEAELEAIRVFSKNVRDVLLAAPAGAKTVMGLDPGLRTGVKVAVIDATGKLLDTTTIYPHAPRQDWEGALAQLGALALRHHVQLIAIGNGTASRETEKLASDLIKRMNSVAPTQPMQHIVVSEAGASVYSASELAAQEFPALDVSLRGAVSIARRLQDPLAELVKIDPKAIGVGQYQHDVNQRELAKALDAVVEDCVNAVGVDVNTASVPLLARVSGLNTSLATQIVHYREQHGAFINRNTLKKVPRLGDKTFELAAGFLRIQTSDHPDANPLDCSSVHPEAYPVVEKMLRHTRKTIRELLGQQATLQQLDIHAFVDERFGVPTVKDIVLELAKPGRDPRPEFKAAQFKEGVEKITDLTVGMVLEGVITNVANFGAFVDIGVHQDGLVHISALGNTFVQDPHHVVKTGQIVKVKVVSVDVARQRIALTMRLRDEASTTLSSIGQKDAARSSQRQKPTVVHQSMRPIENNPFADALSAWKK
jgi:uncharacterized protein